MGTMICLGVGKMEIDWGKNNVFSDHSILFKPEDIKLVPYFYVNDIDSENPEECIVIEYKEGLSRSLSSVKRRLDLLGYTLANVESMYNSLVKEAGFYNMEINLPYETFAALLGVHLSTNTGHRDESFQTCKIVKLYSDHRHP